MSDQFVLTFPCFAIMNADCRGAVVSIEPTGPALIIFSDDDFQREYRRKHSHVGPTIRFDFPEQVAIYLERITEFGIKHVLFDPIGSAGRIFESSNFVQQVLRNLDRE